MVGETWNTVGDDTKLYLKGVATNLKPGDPLLIVDQEKESEDEGSESWDFRRISVVEPDKDSDLTLIQFKEPLGSLIPRMELKIHKVYAMRLRASIFGHNAQLWKALPVALRIGEQTPNTGTLIPGIYADREKSWAEKNFDVQTRTINLDAVYDQVVPGRWIILASPTYVGLYRVTSVGEETKVDYNLIAKTTRLNISGGTIEMFSPRNTTVYIQSEELELNISAQQPYDKGKHSEAIDKRKEILDLDLEKKNKTDRIEKQEKYQRCDIFLSYKSEDKKRAKIFAEALEHQGYSVWWDSNIGPGEKWDETIKEALYAAKCVMVLWSKQSVLSDWVKEEAEYGKSKGALIPILIEDVEIPLGFRRIQAAKLIDWQGALPNPEFDLLVKFIAKKVKGVPGKKK